MKITIITKNSIPDTAAPSGVSSFSQTTKGEHYNETYSERSETSLQDQGNVF